MVRVWEIEVVYGEHKRWKIVWRRAQGFAKTLDLIEVARST